MTATEGSVLDLSGERQEELAAMMGQSLQDWRAGVVARHKEADALRAELDANAVRYQDLTPEERERYDRFQARVDDEVLTSAVLNKRAEEAKRKT